MAIFFWLAVAEILSALASFEYNETRLKQTGKSIWNLERLYTIGEGMEEQLIPKRFFEEALGDRFEGAREISENRFLNARLLYYQGKEWSEKSIPKINKIAELGLDCLR